MPHNTQIKAIRTKLNTSIQIIQLYKWLLDSYVLDFYVDEHWYKMPKSWIEALTDLPPENLANLLHDKSTNEKNVWPLSLLCLRKIIPMLTIPRQPTQPQTTTQKITFNSTNRDDLNNKQEQIDFKVHPRTSNILTKKNIKQKKRHEIERMSQLTANIASECNVKYIVDFGAGLGHLARLLAFGYRLNVCCLEMQVDLTEQAKELDNQITDIVSKISSESIATPVHLNICLTKDTSFTTLVQDIKQSFGIDSNDKSFAFGIIGLHPCGDLAAILMNIFLQSAEAKFLNLVGCCHFKITVPDQIDYNPTSAGYPLSGYLRTKRCHLSFEAREIACHAIEVYAKRLSAKNYENLRVHSFRATIEKIICKHWPKYKHSGLKSIKHLTTFRDYCQQAISHLNGIQIPDDEINAPDTLNNLKNWKLVVIFYTLRLMLAPLVESVILYDRILYLLEYDCRTRISAIFDPSISSRNHIITALKV